MNLEKPTTTLPETSPKRTLPRYFYHGLATGAVVLLATAGSTALYVRQVSRNTPTPTPNSTPIVVNDDTVIPALTSPTPTPSASPSPSLSASPTVAPTSQTDYRALGEKLYGEKNYTDAAAAYQKAIELETDPVTLATLWNLSGNAYREAGNAASAHSAYLKAIATNPLLGDAYLNQAALLWSENKRDEAQAILQQGIYAKASKQQEMQSQLSVYQRFQ